jgi:hypothetical protein
MIQGVNINEMISQSITVLTKPSVATFEQFEKRGRTKEALTYVAVAAVIVGIVGFVFGLFSGIGSAIAGLVIGILSPLVGFYVFAYALYMVGKSQGGTGTQDEVFYTASLYTAPILAVNGIVGRIPVLGCLLAPVTLVLSIYQAYLGYLAARSAMNLDQTKGIITVVVAIIIQLIVVAIIGGIFAAIFVGAAVARGALG